MKVFIHIGQDFSPHPRGRGNDDGVYNAQHLRETLLVPFLEKSIEIELNLDGTQGYAYSFLEEAFGGLILKHDFSEEFLNTHLIFQTPSLVGQRYQSMAQNCIKKAALKKKTPHEIF